MPGPKKREVPEWNQIARMLRQIRRSQDLTQGEVAVKMGVYRSALSTWETGATSPTAALFILWLEALDVEMTLEPRSLRGGIQV